MRYPVLDLSFIAQSMEVKVASILFFNDYIGLTIKACKMFTR